MLCALDWYDIEHHESDCGHNLHSSRNFPIRTTEFDKIDDGSFYHESAQRDSAGAKCQTDWAREREGKIFCWQTITLLYVKHVNNQKMNPLMIFFLFTCILALKEYKWCYFCVAQYHWSAFKVFNMHLLDFVCDTAGD